MHCRICEPPVGPQTGNRKCLECGYPIDAEFEPVKFELNALWD